MNPGPRAAVRQLCFDRMARAVRIVPLSLVKNVAIWVCASTATRLAVVGRESQRLGLITSGCAKGRAGAALRTGRAVGYGVSLLIRVDQFASAVRGPGPWLAPAHVPSRLSPVPPAKNGPPQ